MDQLTSVLNDLLQVSPQMWFLLIGGATGISIITQIIKKLLSLENEKVVMALFAGVSFIVTGVDYLMSAHNLPPTILGVSTVFIMGIATPLYTYVIKPLDMLIADYRTYRSAIADKVAEVKAVDTAASLPNSQVVDVPATPVADKVIETPLPVGTKLPTNVPSPQKTPSDVADF